VISFLAKCKLDGVAQPVINGECRIENYAVWNLARITKVSKHSAIYHFTSQDRLRGNPNLKKGRGRTVWSKTWHTTLLAKVGENSEGPLPWVERDYTPISCAKDWEQGKCDILIKIYSTGRATSWLYKQPLGLDFWLSQPCKTLGVPSLAIDLREVTFKPTSYLLIVAGTGIVLVPQVLHHADPSTCFGSSPAIVSPIRLVYSCRKDDVLLASDLTGWCQHGKLQNLTLVLTEAKAEIPVPFPDVEDADLRTLASLTNATVLNSRLSKEMIEFELKSCSSPCRVVVSGPDSFNAAAREMLLQSGVTLEAITILTA
jgi:NAD(P)H-flavin reductase